MRFYKISYLIHHLKLMVQILILNTWLNFFMFLNNIIIFIFFRFFNLKCIFIAISYKSNTVIIFSLIFDNVLLFLIFASTKLLMRHQGKNKNILFITCMQWHNLYFYLKIILQFYKFLFF